MNCKLQASPPAFLWVSATFPSNNLQSLSVRAQFLPNFKPLRPRNPFKTFRPVKQRQGICFVSGNNDVESSGKWKWESWAPQEMVAEKILRLISGATSSPICQFISSPTTFLHSLDPRIKLVWLLALVVLPARSHIVMRLGLVVYLALLSIWILPTPVWTEQLGKVALLSGILFLMLGFGSDGVPPLVQLRTPPPSMTGLPNLPMSLGGYSYSIMKLGPVQLTRKGLSVASTSACLSFTVFQSASLCLTTTTPEQLASALQWFMLPLTSLGVPVAEIILTLLLSLRFISLVFDEVRNVALGIIARRIQWRRLGMMETLDIFFTYVRRIFKNIFSHAEQISQAMISAKENWHWFGSSLQLAWDCCATKGIVFIHHGSSQRGALPLHAIGFHGEDDWGHDHPPHQKIEVTGEAFKAGVPKFFRGLRIFSTILSLKWLHQKTEVTGEPFKVGVPKFFEAYRSFLLCLV